MNKMRAVLLVAALTIILGGCGATTSNPGTDEKEQEINDQAYTAVTDDAELRNVFDNNPSSIILYGFDEKKYEISDEKDVETIIDTFDIRNGQDWISVDFYRVLVVGPQSVLVDGCGFFCGNEKKYIIKVGFLSTYDKISTICYIPIIIYFKKPITKKSGNAYVTLPFTNLPRKRKIGNRFGRERQL